MRPVFPAHRTLSQAKYMALLRWLMVRQSFSTLSERCMALFAASSASTEFPKRSTTWHKHTSVVTPQHCYVGKKKNSQTSWFTHTFLSGSYVLPADWQFCEVHLLPLLSATCSPAECRHTGQPCDRTTHMINEQTTASRIIHVRRRRPGHTVEFLYIIQGSRLTVMSVKNSFISYKKQIKSGLITKC